MEACFYSMILRVVGFFLALIFPLSSLAVDGSFLRLSAKVVESDVLHATFVPEQRAALVKKAFQDAGCPVTQITEQTVPGNAINTVVCTLPGSEPGSIIVSAGIDYHSAGDELSVQNATLEMLPLLIQSLNGNRRRYSLVFIAFTGEKKQEGSKYYLSQLSGEERKGIRGMVFLDRIGRSPVRYLFPSQSTEPRISHLGAYDSTSGHDPTELNKWLDVASESVALGYTLELSEFYFTHALSFEHKGILSLTLTSPAYTVIERQRGPVRMPAPNVDMPTYYKTYNLLCVYLLRLDSSMKAKN
jgi:hypothetical protein